MAVAVVVSPVCVDYVVASSAALVGGQAPWSILRDLNRNIQQNASPDIRRPLRDLMTQMTLGDSDSDRGITPANLARAIIDVVDRLHPLVEAPHQDRLLTAKERLADFASPANTTTPASGVFLRRQLMDRRAMGDLVDKQLAEAKLIAGGGAIHDAVNTLTFLQGPQILMKKHARALCALENEFSDITPIGSVEGRLDFVQAALEPVAGMSEKIDVILQGISEIREVLRGASGDLEAAETAVRGLVARGGKVENLRKVLQKIMRSDIPQLILKLRRTELERWLELKLIEERTCVAYEYHLSELRKQLEAARNFMELGIKVLEKFSKIGEISRQQSCPFPVNLADHLNEELLGWVVGGGIKLKLNTQGPPLSVPGPSESIWQVVVNLVSNARQAMNHEGKLILSISPAEVTDAGAVQGMGHHFVAGTPRRGDYVVLAVRDSGPGISRDALPRIFDLFYSSHKSGYGLAAVRQIIEDAGGFIGVDSATGEPHGTVFTIYFPRAG